MASYRVRFEAEFTIPHKQNIEATRESALSMIKKSGLDEKDFVISIDKIEEPSVRKGRKKQEKPEVELSIVPDTTPKRHYRKQKKEKKRKVRGKKRLTK